MGHGLGWPETFLKQYSSLVSFLQTDSNPFGIFSAHFKSFDFIPIWSWYQIHIFGSNFHFPRIYLQLQRPDWKSHISTGRACFSAMTQPGWVELCSGAALMTDRKRESWGDCSSWERCQPRSLRFSHHSLKWNHLFITCFKIGKYRVCN